MATPRRSNSTFGDIPEAPESSYRPIGAPEPAQPTAQPKTTGQRIGNTLADIYRGIKNTPWEVGEYARDVARDPLGELGIATAPMMGAGQALAAPAAAARSLRGIGATREFFGNSSLGTLAKASAPTAKQAWGATGLAIPSTLALAQVDRAQTEAPQPSGGFERSSDGTLVYPVGAHMPGTPRPADRKTDGGTPVFASEAKLSLPPADGIYRGKGGSGNAYSSSERGLTEAMRLANQQRTGGFAFGNASGGSNAPADGNATPGRNYADSVQRRGNQGAVIKNPHGMSIEDRMRGLLTSMKGSPSMRRAAAEAMLAEQKDGYDSRQAALDREATADSEQMQARLKANESFADRRLKADAFNQELGFRRRQHNDESILKAAEIAVNARNGVLRRDADGAGKDPEATFISDRYKDVLEKTGSPEIALLEANRMGAQAGITVDSPITRYGQTADSDELNAARDTFNNRWTASSNPDFDPNTAKPVIRTLGDRLKTVFPGGVDPSDRKWEDANGNVDYTDPYAFKTGETPGAYALRRKRELEVRNMQGGK